jgi:tripartite-type tricarboxylate transporter receptor subunit TctC
LVYATAGPGLPHHLFAELFKSMTGIDMTPVAYRGSLAALNDVVAGHVPLMFVDVAPALGMVQAGKVRALGVSTKGRVPAISDVPALDEAGVTGFDAASWQMIVAPAKTPPAIIDKLHDDLATALVLSEIRERIAGQGMLLVGDRSLVELQDFVASEISRWSKIVRQAGLAGSL